MPSSTPRVARDACRKFRVDIRKIALIGSHGQTVFHHGRPTTYLGHSTASTLQIGEASIIAARTGITTVADFRPADIAAGGQGAPLVPFADYVLYRHETLGRVSLNLGGIANITVIPARARAQDVFGTDEKIPRTEMVGRSVKKVFEPENGPVKISPRVVPLAPPFLIARS